METVLDEVAAEFDGEDPLLLALRRVLNHTHQELVEELPEVDEERVTALRERGLHQDSKRTLGSASPPSG